MAGTALAQSDVRAEDRKNDWGGVIRVEWKPAPTESSEDFEGYRVYRSESPTGPWRLVGKAPKGSTRWDDAKEVEEATEYYYRVASVVGGVEGTPVLAPAPATFEANWFFDGRQRNLIGVWLFTSLILGWIWSAGRKISLAVVAGFFIYTLVFTLLILQTELHFAFALVPLLLPIIAVALPLKTKGTEIYIRPIAAVQAVEEAIGRATEMGKPILFVPGISTIEDVATLAALNILSPVAEKAAQYDSRLIVPNYDPIVFTVTQEVVKEACLRAGRPDAYSDENVFFLTARQFAYAAAVNGIMVRERPATNFFLGMFYAESLLLAETGNMTGAIQIAGTDAVTQLPFFIVACDYTLIGEELYAAGAYMGDDPKLTGSLKGQDWNKALCILFLITLPVVYFVYGIFENPDGWAGWFKDIPKTIFEGGKQ
jgi:hypothetical protein